MGYLHSADQMADDAALAAKRLCPECHQFVAAGMAAAHVMEEFPRYALEQVIGTDYHRRALQVLAYDAPAAREAQPKEAK